MASVVVTVTEARTGREFELDPGAPFTFGRHQDCTLALEGADDAISRLAGMISCDRGAWFITNLSESRPLRLIDDTRHTARTLAVSPPGGTPSRFALGDGDVTIAIPGAVTHNLIVSFQDDESFHETSVTSAPLPKGASPTQIVQLTPRQRDVLNVMARGYVQPHPRFHPEPLTYAQVAERLGISSGRVERHVSEIRARMMDASLPDLIDLPDARRRICELAVALHVVTRASVAEIDQRSVDGFRPAPSPTD